MNLSSRVLNLCNESKMSDLSLEIAAELGPALVDKFFKYDFKGIEKIDRADEADIKIITKTVDVSKTKVDVGGKKVPVPDGFYEIDSELFGEYFEPDPDGFMTRVRARIEFGVDVKAGKATLKKHEVQYAETF